MSAQISIFYLFIYLFFLKRSQFHGDSIVNRVAVLQFEVCLFEHVFGGKNRPIVTKFLYVFEVTNFSSYLRNCDYILDTFLQGHTKIFNAFFNINFHNSKR